MKKLTVKERYERRKNRQIDITNKIIEHRHQGNAVGDTCALFGITKGTYFNYLKKAGYNDLGTSHLCKRYNPQDNSWFPEINDQTLHDAQETAKTMLGIPKIIPIGYKCYTVQEFEQLQVKNHPARLNTPLDKLYTDYKDIQTVNYYTTNKRYPAVILSTPTQYIVLDGAHRITASYITNTPICALIVSTPTNQSTKQGSYESITTAPNNTNNNFVKIDISKDLERFEEVYNYYK